MTKRCRQCGQDKPLTEFYAHAAMADGHLNKCKDCVKARVAAHRTANVEAIREYDRERQRRPERRLQVQRNAANWRVDNPEKYRAHTALNNALRDGVLHKKPCEVCGSGEVHAHHDDYSRPLDVRWLCPVHHAVERAA